MASTLTITSGSSIASRVIRRSFTLYCGYFHFPRGESCSGGEPTTAVIIYGIIAQYSLAGSVVATFLADVCSLAWFDATSDLIKWLKDHCWIYLEPLRSSLRPIKDLFV